MPQKRMDVEQPASKVVAQVGSNHLAAIVGDMLSKPPHKFHSNKGGTFISNEADCGGFEKFSEFGLIR